ncbi:transmembrane protein 234 isoform X3 [Sinocyclocheilus rhinocerous]|uniref:transmembrane protein 234 isoform X3 n=1 Tax=Sinocyclocheilus rhinocerous TaxID=307959 RepID=UPI0007B78FB9|nr:PREDICTED: transmembrane protein 234 isoform X3 [Sinocyclocheilus rhinocerous]
MVSTSEVFCLLLVAMLWGGTNPFLKKGTEGIEGVQKDNKLLQFLAEIKFLFLNMKYLVPFLLNQSGSLVFYFTLASTGAVLGMLLIMSGVTVCVLSSVSETDSAGAHNTSDHYIPLDKEVKEDCGSAPAM